MTSRREILQGAALATMPLASCVPESAAVASTSGSHFHAVIVDPRHAQSLQFGTRLASRGVRPAALSDGDVTGLWLADIEPAWRKAPVSLTGLTRLDTLFCLEQLAWSHGLRVSFHAEHVLDEAHATAHALHRADIGSSLSRGLWWPTAAADLVLAQAASRAGHGLGPSLASLSPTLPGGADVLASWIIAPV